ncbi:Ldh family oxidoreductase [Terrihabitans rhizophilus]|uniref:Ldh family oxidoreductase n=1 Tax=Terrihabitans rhizophilus TaxID=3092662 RepID=A0ABU4RMX4_9HYPH|nr:Ldh family oxidoreductase [Terrihabitans sp. PJ23]MDX6806187.1 Ldh family oxidoreductase [Terrihabitans sp. PJ23]
MSEGTPSPAPQIVSLDRLDRFCRDVLAAVGADAPTCDAVTRAMMHGTRLGVDSHGVRLLAHYVSVLEGGRVNKTPRLSFSSKFGAIAALDLDHGHGALGAYVGMGRAIELAETLGIGAVAIRNSSHFGAAGAFAYEAAQRGFIGLSLCHSDSFMRLHDGAQRFHGTNPIACAVPVEGSRPWLLDMATSAITYNRVQLYKSLKHPVPEGMASDQEGRDTFDAEDVDMLAPLGNEVGFKGAGLAGLVSILCAVLPGMALDFDILPMNGEDKSTPRRMGAFVMAIRPDAIVERHEFSGLMTRYVETLRASPARPGARVLAPGDREWEVADVRDREGAPIDPATEAAFREFSGTYGVALPFEENSRTL